MREETQADHVFLDRSGRRRRLLKIVGAGVATSLVTILLLLVAALSGVSPVDLPGLPHAAGKDHTQPTARPSATDAVHPVDTRNAVGPEPSASPTTGSPTPSATRRHGQPSRSPHPSRSK